MSTLSLLSKAKTRWIEPLFPLSHGIPRVDNRRVVSGIVYFSPSVGGTSKVAGPRVKHGATARLGWDADDGLLRSSVRIHS